MLDNATKKQKNGTTVIIALTLLFVVGSAPAYNVQSASAAGTMYAPILKPTEINQSAITPLSREADLIVQIPNIGKLNGKIETLELTVEAKDMTITALKEQKEIELAAQRNLYVSMDQALIELSSYVGVSPYGFGDSPKRWDCSGLTLWFYQKYRGIELPHSATSQMREGEIVDAPIPGDLVAFKRSARNNAAFHIGIYIGSGMFIHAKNHAADTVLETVEGFAKDGISVVYVRY